jgi:predicted HicB family RNase H-like nuclease
VSQTWQTRRLTLRLPEELYDWLLHRAEAEDRTVNNLIVHILRLEADRYKPEAPDR